MKDITFSIIMPTYNSEKTIEYSLNSISIQKYDLNRVECLVIDGGSTDATLEIAKRYSFVKTLENPKRLPEYAKQIGFLRAEGKYIIKMDSDEAFTDENTLFLREKAFLKHREAHLLIANELKYCYDINKEPCGTYINACGDPFTYFIYRQKKQILQTFRSSIVSEDDDGICLLDFSSDKVRPIADGGTSTFNRIFIEEEFGKDVLEDISFICSVSDRILDRTDKCICIDQDIIDHRSKADLKSYLKKIKFRVINNIFSKNEAGFSSRSISSGNKKLLFPIYTITFFPAFIDSVILAAKYKDAYMLLHIFYCYYTCALIAGYLIMKALRIDVRNKEY